jgi:hypothetical protein
MMSEPWIKIENTVFYNPPPPSLLDYVRHPIRHFGQERWPAFWLGFNCASIVFLFLGNSFMRAAF